MRLAAIRDTARAIMDGHIERRVPQTGGNSEFDQLAGELNRMLGRIGALMDALRQVSADIAHDLRTPLTRLRATLESVSAMDTSQQARGAITNALAEADEALDLFAALLAISEVEGQGGRSRFAQFDLAQSVRRIADAYGPALDDAGLALTTDLASVKINGDRALMERATSNLLDNLIAHTPRGTRATFTLAEQAGEAVLALADDGPGVPVDAETRIFDRFVRLDAARSGPGNGLGLNLVAAVVRAHDGHVTASNASPGLRIEITVPTQTSR